MSGWCTATWDDGDHVHVLPQEDVVDHTKDDAGECVCGPVMEPCPRQDGSMGWLITHNSLDGREQREVAK